jgi:hypothetical protein
VTSYTITITPDDNSATTTTLRLDTSGGNVTLTDLHLHAGNILSTGAVPAIDYDLLLQAITPGAPTPVLTGPAPRHEIEAAPVFVSAADAPVRPARATSTATKATTKATTKSASRAAKSAATATKATATATKSASKATTKSAPSAAKSASKATRATTRRAPGKKVAAAEAAPAPATTAKSRGRRAGTSARSSAQSSTADAAMAKKTAKAAPAKKSATRATTVAAAGERAYRRMPDDFATVYGQAGNAAAVADHYGVPRHTAHGWIRRLRGQESATASR